MLDNGMIAVSYDGTNWVKADRTNLNNSWYNYENLMWANAVTVTSSTRETYKNASVGAVINMNDIETMWVWIPRYSYTIGSVDGTNYYGKQGEYLDSTPTLELPGEIDIKFVSENTKDRGTAKYIVSDGISNNSWYTPDAFTFDDEELRGIWVGKFEPSSSNPSASYGGGNTTSLDAIIKPNVTSWRQINVSNAFKVSLKMNDNGNRYGIESTTDTHMMKNSEWAVVAYLSQSKYGKLGNTNFSGVNKEIYQNKSEQYITGCSTGKPYDVNATNECIYTYDIDINGTGSSTTGTIYGVYDMSGGSLEHVMANYNDMLGNSGFETMPYLKYYDKYITDDVNTACNGNECISHALSETSSWYNDVHLMPIETETWMTRGGMRDGENNGIFYFSNANDSGGMVMSYSFRLTATIR